jgi:4-hydroxy-L-threonine phosphate dehydrogenase PdxA
MKKPFIGVPIGDPAGIGPEIVVKSIAREDTNSYANTVIFGDKKVLENAIKICDLDLEIKVIEDVKDGVYDNKTLNLIDLDNIDMDKFEFGKVSGMCGKASYEYVKKIS